MYDVMEDFIVVVFFFNFLFFAELETISYLPTASICCHGKLSCSSSILTLKLIHFSVFVS